MAYQKKLKLVVTKTLVPRGDEGSEPTLQDQLMAHCVKVNGTWRYQSDVKQPHEKKKKKDKDKPETADKRIREELMNADPDDKFPSYIETTG